MDVPNNKYVNLNECISNVVKPFVHCHCTFVFKGTVANNTGEFMFIIYKIPYISEILITLISGVMSRHRFFYEPGVFLMT